MRTSNREYGTTWDLHTGYIDNKKPFISSIVYYKAVYTIYYHQPIY
jgi:hypothetical protein